jgi:hypothetical protein
MEFSFELNLNGPDRNGKSYPKEAQEKIIEQIKSGSKQIFLGMGEINPDPSKMAGYISKAYFENSSIKIHALTFGGSHEGKVLNALLDAGAKISMSPVCYAERDAEGKILPDTIKYQYVNVELDPYSTTPPL